MTAQELFDAGVVNVKLVYWEGPNPPMGCVTEAFYGIRQVNDDLLKDFTFDSITEDAMAIYKVAG